MTNDLVAKASGGNISTLDQRPGFRQDVFSLDDGQVILRWPEKMSASSYEDFKDWIEIQVRKIGRSVKSE